MFFLNCNFITSVLETVAIMVVADILRNGDLYRSTDIRPAYTYASLIRQVGLSVT